MENFPWIGKVLLWLVAFQLVRPIWRSLTGWWTGFSARKHELADKQKTRAAHSHLYLGLESLNLKDPRNLEISSLKASEIRECHLAHRSGAPFKIQPTPSCLEIMSVFCARALQCAEPLGLVEDEWYQLAIREAQTFDNLRDIPHPVPPLWGVPWCAPPSFQLGTREVSLEVQALLRAGGLVFVRATHSGNLGALGAAPVQLAEHTEQPTGDTLVFRPTPETLPPRAQVPLGFLCRSLLDCRLLFSAFEGMAIPALQPKPAPQVWKLGIAGFPQGHEATKSWEDRGHQLVELEIPLTEFFQKGHHLWRSLHGCQTFKRWPLWTHPFWAWCPEVLLKILGAPALKVYAYNRQLRELEALQRDWVDWYRQQGIHLIMVPPSMATFDSLKMAEMLKCPAVADQNRTLIGRPFDDDLFLDTCQLVGFP